MKKAIFAAVCALCFSAICFAQPRAPEKVQTVSTATEWQVRYEGGVFGSSAKEHGTIKIDEANQRVIFVRQSDGNAQQFAHFFQAGPESGLALPCGCGRRRRRGLRRRCAGSGRRHLGSQH